MSNEVIIGLMLLIFLIAAWRGVPIAFAMIGSVFVAAIFTPVTIGSLVGQLFNGVNSVPLMALPFFLLVAELANSTDIAQRIMRFVVALVGRFRAALHQIDILFSVLFSGMTGSANADVAVNARILYPALRREGYNLGKSAALIAASSTLAQLIPPSIIAIVYGATMGISVSNLFLAGFVPGVLLAAAMMIYILVSERRRPPGVGAGMGEILTSARRATLPMLVPLVILGGILSGVFTPTEAGMVAVMLVVVVYLPIAARSHFKRLPQDLKEAALIYSTPLIAISAASAFAWLFTYLGGGNLVSGLILSISGDSQVSILIAVAIVLVIVGQFLDAIPVIVLFAPIIAQVTELGGIDPLHMGVVVITCLALGLVSPPYGVCLLLSTKLAGIPFLTGVRYSLPLYGLFLIVIAFLIAFPQTILWIPALLN